MTKQKTWKSIRFCCYTTLVFCTAWAALLLLGFIGLLTGKGGVDHAIDWSQNNVLMKIVFLVVDIISAAVTIGICVKAALNFLKGSRDSIVFPQSNVGLFFWLALAYFVHRLCWSNHSIYFENDFVFCYVHSNLVIPFCILFFAFMYKVAADAVEENNLTI